MCVSIHLECWLGKARVEIVTWAAVSVASQQQFSYNSVIKFGSVNAIDVDSIRIQTESSVKRPRFNSHSNRIQCEKASKAFLTFFNWWIFFFSTNQTTLEPFFSGMLSIYVYIQFIKNLFQYMEISQYYAINNIELQYSEHRPILPYIMG